MRKHKRQSFFRRVLRDAVDNGGVPTAADSPEAAPPSPARLVPPTSRPLSPGTILVVNMEGAATAGPSCHHRVLPPRQSLNCISFYGRSYASGDGGLSPRGHVTLHASFEPTTTYATKLLTVAEDTATV
jgi:hypothetical protein